MKRVGREETRIAIGDKVTQEHPTHATSTAYKYDDVASINDHQSNGKLAAADELSQATRSLFAICFEPAPILLFSSIKLPSCLLC